MALFRSNSSMLSLALLVVALAERGTAADLTPAMKLVPESTQGFVRIVDVPRFSERFDQTQLGMLIALESMTPFWEEQLSEIERRLKDAGWQLNLSLKDVRNIATGQVAMAWIDRSEDIRKPYSVILIIDVEGREEKAQEVLTRIDTQLVRRNATRKSVPVGSNEVIQYVLPRQPGEIVVEESFYVMAGGQLLAASDLKTIEFALQQQSDGVGRSLLDLESFQNSRQNFVANLSSPDVEYFVNPLGLAKVIRSISHQPTSRQTDVIKVLTNQGFDKISAVSGNLQLLDQELDVHHECFVYAPQPRPESVKILDFPNAADPVVPFWIGEKAATYMTLNWNANEAFWKAEGLVDEYVGSEDTFKGVIDGIQVDPKGPQIDLRNDFLPYMTNEIYVVSDLVEPITPDSRRSLIAIRVKDANKISKLVDRVMKVEPDASPIEFEQHRIWIVSRDAGEDLSSFGIDDLDEPETDDDGSEEPWLDHYAVAMHGEFLLFSSHTDMIKSAITANGSSQLADQPDFARVRGKIVELSGGAPKAMWSIGRTDLSFKMQYELFRQDQLPQSRSMLATIADRLLKPKRDVAASDVQQVKGDLLPPFEDIRQYLQPSGTMMMSSDRGWSIRTFILGAQDRPAETSAPQASVNTARQVILGESQGGTQGPSKR